MKVAVVAAAVAAAAVTATVMMVSYSITLTCQIIVQQILLFSGKNTYTTLLGSTRFLIYEIFP